MHSDQIFHHCPVVVEVVDSLTNNGLVVIGPFNGITLKFTGANPIIDGIGELRMTGPGPGDAAISAPGKTITHESDHLIKVSISGSTNLAKITGNMGSFLNKGTIQVDEGVLVIDPSSPFENTGTMKAKGPNSIIRWNGGPTDVFLQNGQLISENNGRIEFSPGPGVGAVVGPIKDETQGDPTFQTIGDTDLESGQVIVLSTASLSFDDVIIPDDTTVEIFAFSGGGTNLEILTNLDNDGRFDLNAFNGIDIQFKDGATWSGTGEFRMLDNTDAAGSTSISQTGIIGGPLTHPLGHKITVDLDGNSAPANLMRSTGSMINRGTVDVVDGTLIIDPGSPFDNRGTVKIQPQGEVQFSSGASGNENDVFNNFSLVDNSMGGDFFNNRLFINHCGGIVLASILDITLSFPFGTINQIPCSPEICDDGIDNDGDGLVDGDDADCQAPEPEPEAESSVVAGEIIPIEQTSLLLAGTQTFSWMIPVLLSGIGIGLFAVSRKSE